MSYVDTAARVGLTLEPILGFTLPVGCWYVTSGLDVRHLRYPEIYVFIGVALAFCLWFIACHDAAVKRLR